MTPRTSDPMTTKDEAISERSLCELCGEPMPAGEEMFKFHGYSGPCPKPPLPKEPSAMVDRGYHETAVAHARKQGHADGFQVGWHAALTRIQQGDVLDDLRVLVPEPPQ